MIIVVLPAYDEEQNIEPLIRETVAALGTRDFRLIVVDDGSRDGTPEILARLAREMPLTVITHEKNLGLGRTLFDGLKRATEQPGAGDAIVTMDADQSHDPAYIPAMATELGRGARVVIASRFAPGGGQEGVAPLRRLLSGGAGLMLRRFFPIPGVRDYTTGYRAYDGAALKGAFDSYGPGLVTETGFAASAEILIKLAAHGLRVVEIPFTLRYDLKKSASKIKISRTIGRYLQMMFRLRRQLGALPALRDKKR